MRILKALPFLLSAMAATNARSAIAASIPVKVVVVAMFELGADPGDAPGEYQFWVEREHLDRTIPFPAGNRDLRMNANGVLAVLTGQGTAKAASSIMALGLDPRFDLSKAYWVVAGIAGADPAKATLGAAVWTDWVVDGDLGYEIDAREIPSEWTTGFVPLGKVKPYEQPVTVNDNQVYKLNPELLEWAYQLTKDIQLGDTDNIRARRAQFPQEAARRKPSVLQGSELSSSTYWHGKKLSEWANAWVAYYTEGKGTYVTTAMEDTGTLQALTFLGKAGKVDYARVMVLRTVSNFDQQRPDVTAAESLAEQRVSKYGGYLPSLESAYSVGHVVVDTIVENWSKYGRYPPGEKQPAKEAARSKAPIGQP